MPPRALATALVLALAPPYAVAAADTTAAPPYRGNAYDTERRVDAYVEEHVEGYCAGRHVYTRTAFLSPDGKPLGDRDLDFGRSACAPDYRFRDFRNGYEEGAVVEAAAVRVRYRDSARAPLREKAIEVPEPRVINGGVGEFVRAHWDELAAGGRVPFNMVIPARLDWYRFVAYVDRKFALTPAESRGKAYLPVVIEPKNSMLAMLLPTIVMYEDAATRRLLRYQGIANVADAKGRSLRVRVDYGTRGP